MCCVQPMGAHAHMKICEIIMTRTYMAYVRKRVHGRSLCMCVHVCVCVCARVCVCVCVSFSGSGRKVTSVTPLLTREGGFLVASNDSRVRLYRKYTLVS